MPSSLHLLTSDDDDVKARSVDVQELELSLSTGMERLQAACDARGRGDRRLETASCNLAWRIATLIHAAELANIRLPRGYVARTRSSEPYLEKYASPDVAGTEPPAEPILVLTRQDSIVARMDPGARRLSYEQLAEFRNDLEDGLIEEIAAFIENCSAREDEAADRLNKILKEPKPAGAARKLSQIGRRKRSAGGS